MIIGHRLMAMPTYDIRNSQIDAGNALHLRPELEAREQKDRDSMSALPIRLKTFAMAEPFIPCSAETGSGRRPRRRAASAVLPP